MRPYLHSLPHDQNEDAQVPRGTSIPVYLFPGLKGRSRVQVNNGVLPADASQRDTLATLKYGLGGLSVAAFLLLVLIRLRRECFQEAEPRSRRLPAHRNVDGAIRGMTSVSTTQAPI